MVHSCEKLCFLPMNLLNTENIHFIVHYTCIKQFLNFSHKCLHTIALLYLQKLREKKDMYDRAEDKKHFFIIQRMKHKIKYGKVFIGQIERKKKAFIIMTKLLVIEHKEKY